MEGYYDHHPTVRLERPIALAGYVGEENRLLGYKMAALCGLPSADLDRLVEHHAGSSVWDLIWQQGEASYRALEHRCLKKILQERPAGVLSLGDGTLIDPANRQLVEQEAHLVVLERDLPHCFFSLKRGPRSDKDFWHPLHAGPLERLETLRPYFDRRSPGLAEPPHAVTLVGKREKVLLDELLDLVSLLSTPLP